MTPCACPGKLCKQRFHYEGMFEFAVQDGIRFGHHDHFFKLLPRLLDDHQMPINTEGSI
jgi:hypothetical protein